jgi:hypothetical protein
LGSDDKEQDMIIPEIKQEIRSALRANPELNDTHSIFLISSRKPELGEMSDLFMYVEENIGGLIISCSLSSKIAFSMSMSIFDRTRENGLPNLRNSRTSHTSSSPRTLSKKMKKNSRNQTRN